MPARPRRLRRAPRRCCTAQGGEWLPGFADGAYWQVLTSGFTHVAITHIVFNMLALWVIGPQLELALGRVRFLALYLLSLLAGSAVVLLGRRRVPAHPRRLRRHLRPVRAR